MMVGKNVRGIGSALVLGLSVLAVTSFGSSGALAAAAPADVSALVGDLADISMKVSVDGKMEIAGVISSMTDKTGATIVEVWRNGDFKTDPVLVLNVPIVYDLYGNPQAQGFEAFASTANTLTLTFGGNRGNPIGIPCQAEIPLPPNPPSPVCATVDGCGQGRECGWYIPDGRQVLVCGCVDSPKPQK